MKRRRRHASPHTSARGPLAGAGSSREHQPAPHPPAPWSGGFQDAAEHVVDRRRCGAGSATALASTARPEAPSRHVIVPKRPASSARHQSACWLRTEEVRRGGVAAVAGGAVCGQHEAAARARRCRPPSAGGRVGAFRSVRLPRFGRLGSRESAARAVDRAGFSRRRGRREGPGGRPEAPAAGARAGEGGAVPGRFRPQRVWECG